MLVVKDRRVRESKGWMHLRSSRRKANVPFPSRSFPLQAFVD
ncbi:hypothetical protein HMPREF0083_01758 [Aneurinibacillus aneurinilyticus ATCC 12856]|uniref:Uncharacterized protein n=1 Tax=Aneurinibacillus aneurinilyticus ATCC 12856 TaxID=649747 RepID=U1WNG0_ANEAE|nr:hypothetical protein HMPREF0083_01758 [Aneurinibacillus aneurinilyticus ATCC 12856]